MTLNTNFKKINIPIQDHLGDPRPGDLELSPPLPSLFSNNSIVIEKNSVSCSIDPAEQLTAIQALTSLLTPYHKKAAQTLYLNVERLVMHEAKSINHVGFLTLTFPDNVTDNKEAYRRFRSFNTNYLSKNPIFKAWVHVKERQKRGAWHYHLIVALTDDIRTGINFDELNRGIYSSAGPFLRSLWNALREKLPDYGFGRSELLPVRSNGAAMARYVGKYISKHMGASIGVFDHLILIICRKIQYLRRGCT